MKIPLSLALLGMAVVATVAAWAAPGGRIPEMPEFELPKVVRPEKPEAPALGRPESYLVFGIMPGEISAVTYDAWILGTDFVMMRTLDASGEKPEREKAAFKSHLGEITAVNFVSMRDDYFVPGVFKAAPMTAAWDGSALAAWLADGVDTYGELVGGFQSVYLHEMDLDGRQVEYAKVLYHSEKDNLDIQAIFATWASAESGNAYLLFAMTAPEFTPDDALDKVLSAVSNLGDYIEVPVQGSGDPLKGLNVACSGGCSSADGKTVEVNFDD